MRDPSWAAAQLPNPTTKGGGHQQPVAGRAATTRPVRRRQRASRRAPTTMVNTSVSNFRAMVQQFTGIPSAVPYSRVVGGGAEGYDFDQESLMMSFGNLQQQQQQQQQQQEREQYDHLMQGQESSQDIALLLRQQQQQPQLFSDCNSTFTGCDYGGYEGGGDVLRGRPSADDYNSVGGDGFLFDGTHSGQMMMMTSAGSSSRHGFLS